MIYLNSSPCLAIQSWQGYITGPGMMGWRYGFGIIGWPMMIVIWVLIIAGLIFLIRWLVHSIKQGKKNEETSLDLLKKLKGRNKQRGIRG